MNKVIIIGGVAGGMSTAARLRRLNESAQIIVFEKGDYVSFANCGLPYYIGDEITDRAQLTLQTPESFKARFNVDVRIAHEVIAILPADKKVQVRNLKTGQTFFETYDKLVLSPGAEPIKPPLPGINHPNIFTLRNIPDTDKIKNFINEHHPRSVAIVGAGFIGLEMAENLHNLGINVSIIELSNQVMNVVDYDMASIVHQHLHEKGISFFLKTGVTAFTDVNNSIDVTLSNDKHLLVDMVMLSVGVRPETKLAHEAGLTIGKKGGIVVNEYLQTSDENIYAAGDAIETLNPLTQKYGLVPLAGPANKQGRIIANNLVEQNSSKYLGSIGTAVAKVFDLTVAIAGATEKLLLSENIPYLTTTIHAGSHAGYYPGAHPITLKIQFSPTNGRLLGAQAIGHKGVDKRIDVLALAIQNNLSINDLMEFEHTYAPPFSSAKDPVNMIAFVASNMLSGKYKTINWQQIKELDLTNAALIDVRTAGEYTFSRIGNAVNIPVDDLRSRLAEIPKNKKLVIYCAAGLRGYIASRILLQLGFSDVVNLTGGYKTYQYATQTF